jgi:hypothetical protein
MTFRAITVSAFATLIALAACGGGPGVSGSVGFGRDDAGTGRDNPGSGRQDPGPGRDNPGTTNNCPACDQWYKCVGTSGGQQGSVDIHLVTNDQGLCVEEGTNGKVVISCDGTITVDGQKVGTWSGIAGGFTLTTGDTQATCTPEPAPQHPGGGTNGDAG